MPKPTPKPVLDPTFDDNLGADTLTIEDCILLQRFKTELDKDNIVKEQLIAYIYIYIEVFLYCS
ncbi:uncharacterized protein THITE_42614 [Thermothielavioides terrestris NRRL 8126]|uniref:Uncharacterized protein n=1 Tax=Thermothielavioides terrestris (strain ATCC 38088 / NRRL 8126) TaxID=578455 RepID=G2R9Z2_THETT|nr:uncharacterized protein THITE_42614 [Thermothielavioides terrestris NRRL 8126]AEO68777.1 hypothetical protein THITE_42614 [Thermothielavioides terrestris NRRL 8126]